MPEQIVSDERYEYRKVGDAFITAQKIEEPEWVAFYWNPKHELAPFLDAIWNLFGDEHRAPKLSRFVRKENISKPIKEFWLGLIWNDDVDNTIKKLAGLFINLRFSNPERTTLMIQDYMWPVIDND